MFIASLWTSIVAWFTPTVLFCVSNIIIATIYIASNNNNDNNNKHIDHAHSDSVSRITRVSSILSRTRSMNLSSYIPTTTTEPQYNYEYQSNPLSYTSSSRLAQSIHQSPSYVAPLEISNDYETSSFECEQLPVSDQLTRTPSILERVKSIKLSSFYTEPEHITNSSSQLDRVPSFFDRVKSFRISSPLTYETPSITQTDPSQHPDHHVTRSKSENTTSVIKKKGLVSEMKKSRSEMRIADCDDEEEDVNLRRPATTRESRGVVDEEVDVKADHFISRFKQQLRLQRLESLARYNDMLKRRSSN